MNLEPRPPGDDSRRRILVVLGEHRGREVGVVCHRLHVVNGSGRWVAWMETFAVWIDGKEMAGHWSTRDLAEAVASIPRLVRYVEWDEAGRPWPPTEAA